tara:strand:- start:4757 stop:4990 length:234 start_codon:yes stop_codon:yes gene_type:complete
MEDEKKVLATFNAYSKHEVHVYTNAFELRYTVDHFLNWLRQTSKAPPMSNGKPTYDPDTLDRVRERFYEELECLLED